MGEVLGLHYAVPWPNRELATARPFRRSPLHHLLAGKGAVFGSKMGWERPNVFAPLGQEPPSSTTPGAGPSGWPGRPRSRPATRERVAVFDETSFGKLLVVGRDAETVLQRLCTADVAVEPGRAVYTGMLNERAGYEADVTVTRLAPDRYLLVTSAASPVRDAAWIERHLRAGEHVSVVDVSSASAVLGVMGPASRELLGRLGSADLSDEAFPFSTSREIALGYATVRATRITYVGELGWELYVPTEFAVGVYEDLVGAGADLGLVDAGYYAINSLRLDKGYRAFGSDLTPDYTPLEAGLRFTCKLATPIDFVGRTALEAAIAAGPRRRLVSFRVGDPDVMLWGGELVLHDGAPAGQVSSAAWSVTCGAAVGLAYVWRQDREPCRADDLASWNLGGDGGRPGGADGRPARGALRPRPRPGSGAEEARTTGRIVVSALGFGVAYYFDRRTAGCGGSDCSGRWTRPPVASAAWLAPPRRRTTRASSSRSCAAAVSWGTAGTTWRRHADASRHRGPVSSSLVTGAVSAAGPSVPALTRALRRRAGR